MQVTMKRVYVLMLLAMQWTAAIAASPADRILTASDAGVAEIAKSIATALA